MDRETQSMIYDQITNCSKNINETRDDPGYDDVIEDDN